MNSWRSAGWACALAITSVVAIETPAFAQQVQQRGGAAAAQADALFEEGRKAMDAQDYLTAKDKFEASVKIMPGPGTLLNIGYCYERLGLPAVAYRVYGEAVAAAEKVHRLDRVATANARLADLRRKLGLVNVVAPAGTTITIDGVAVTGTAAIDEGRHVLRATARGRVPWSHEVTAKKGETVTIEVPEFEPEATATGATKTRDAPSPESARRAIGLTVAGAGVVGIGVGVVLGLNAKSTYDKTTGHCNDQVCDADGVDLTDRAKTSAAWSTVATGVGIAALAGGLVLFFTAPKSTDVGVGASATASGLRLTVRHVF